MSLIESASSPAFEPEQTDLQDNLERPDNFRVQEPDTGDGIPDELADIFEPIPTPEPDRFDPATPLLSEPAQDFDQDAAPFEPNGVDVFEEISSTDPQDKRDGNMYADQLEGMQGAEAHLLEPDTDKAIPQAIQPEPDFFEASPILESKEPETDGQKPHGNEESHEDNKDGSRDCSKGNSGNGSDGGSDDKGRNNSPTIPPDDPERLPDEPSENHTMIVGGVPKSKVIEAEERTRPRPYNPDGKTEDEIRHFLEEKLYSYPSLHLGQINELYDNLAIEELRVHGGPTGIRPMNRFRPGYFEYINMILGNPELAERLDTQFARASRGLAFDLEERYGEDVIWIPQPLFTTSHEQNSDIANAAADPDRFERMIQALGTGQANPAVHDITFRQIADRLQIDEVPSGEEGIATIRRVLAQVTPEEMAGSRALRDLSIAITVTATCGVYTPRTDPHITSEALRSIPPDVSTVRGFPTAQLDALGWKPNPDDPDGQQFGHMLTSIAQGELFGRRPLLDLDQIPPTDQESLVDFGYKWLRGAPLPGNLIVYEGKLHPTLPRGYRLNPIGTVRNRDIRPARLPSPDRERCLSYVKDVAYSNAAMANFMRMLDAAARLDREIYDEHPAFERLMHSPDPTVRKQALQDLYKGGLGRSMRNSLRFALGIKGGPILDPTRARQRPSYGLRHGYGHSLDEQELQYELAEIDVGAVTAYLTRHVDEFIRRI